MDIFLQANVELLVGVAVIAVVAVILLGVFLIFRGRGDSSSPSTEQVTPTTVTPTEEQPEDAPTEEEPEAEAHPLTDITGVGPTYREKLADAGVEDTRDLLGWSGDEKAKGLSEETGISEKLISKWMEEAEKLG